MKAPMIQQWNVSFERQLPWASLVRVAYEGQESYHLFGSVEGNAAIYNPALSATANRTNVNTRRPLGQYYQGLALGEDVGTASFNALEVSMEKRMTQGLTFLAGYRWSKALDESEEAFFDADAYSTPNPKNDRGPASFNVPNQFLCSYSWMIPTPHGIGSVGSYVLGGWETNGILTLHSGLPFTISSGIDDSLSAISKDRADLVGNPGVPGGRSTAQQLQEWFNTQAFVVNALGTFGTSERNFLEGPGLANFDFSIVRSFPIKKGPLAERQALQFRKELFNSLNHPNFNAPSASVSSSTFGRVTSAGNPRILQFGLKFVY
jgi:hypothetical protein